jgi:hypothetical protein
MWSPLIAGVLSLVVPGLGQIYKGQIVGGILWFIFTVWFYLVLIFPGFALHLCCVIFAAAGDPNREPISLARAVMHR